MRESPRAATAQQQTSPTNCVVLFSKRSYTRTRFQLCGWNYKWNQTKPKTHTMSLIISWLPSHAWFPSQRLSPSEIVCDTNWRTNDKKEILYIRVEWSVLFEYIVHRCLSIMFPVHVRGKIIAAISCARNISIKKLIEAYSRVMSHSGNMDTWTFKWNMRHPREQQQIHASKLHTQKKEGLCVWIEHTICRANKSVNGRENEQEPVEMRKRKHSYNGKIRLMRSELNWLTWLKCVCFS